MPYTSKFEVSPFRNTFTLNYLADGIPVTQTLEKSGEIPTKSFQRLGSNNPENYSLLAYLKKFTPRRVRFKTVLKIVGYRSYLKRVSYVKRVTHRVFSHYEIYHGFKSGPNRVVEKRRPIFRYVVKSYLRYRLKRVVKPIKVRFRVPIFNEGRIDSVTSISRPYLLPNLLTYCEGETQVYPKKNSSSTAVAFSDTTTFLGATREGNVVIPFLESGYPVSVGSGVWFSSTYMPFLPPVDDIYLSATSVHGLYKKVSDNVPSTLTSLAELPQTLKSIYKILTDGIKLAKSLRSLDARTAYKVVNSAVKARKDSLSGVSSKVWLSWYLAVAPTISDIQSHVEALSREERTWKKYSKSTTQFQGFQDEAVSIDYFFNQSAMTTVKWSCIIEGRMVMDEFKRKLQDSDNITAGLYAIVPFSFIADWIVDISSYLESASIFEGLNYVAWKTSISSINEYTRSRVIGYNSGDLAFTEKPNKFFSKQFRVDREPVLDLPDMPLIPWKRNVVDQTLINRSLTAASLFRVLASKRN